MNTVDKLNNVLGWLTAMNFDKPELSNDLEEPLNVLSEAISEVENIAVTQCCKSDSELLSCNHEALISIGDGFGNTFCPMCKTHNPTT